MSFLGCIINQEGIIMDNTKVKVVAEWPASHTVKDLQCFLGFALFYWCFILLY